MKVVPVTIGALAPTNDTLAPLTWRDPARPGACSAPSFYTRVLPSRAIELAAVFLDRNVEAILARRGGAIANLQQKQKLAAIIHLCGAASAAAFARRAFHLTTGERCGEHDVGTYLAQVNAMKQEFLRLGNRI